ncbi:hypothetical protein JCM6882_000872 [Rhodosporidiobolus microsporus]
MEFTIHSTLHIAFGVPVRSVSILLAAQLHFSSYGGSLRALELILARKHSGRLRSARTGGGDAFSQSAVERVPLEIWEAVSEEVRRLAKEALRASERELLIGARCGRCSADEEGRIQEEEEEERAGKIEEQQSAPGWFEWPWRDCESCVSEGMDKVSDLMESSQGLVDDFLDSYGLGISDWLHFEHYNPCDASTPASNSGELSAYPLDPLATVVVELLPLDEGSDSTPVDPRHRIPAELWTDAPSGGPVDIASAIIRVEAFKAREQRRGLWLWFLRDWGVELVNKENGGRPVLTLRMESNLSV